MKLAGTAAGPQPFPHYMQMPRRLPIRAWRPLRIASVAFTLGVVALLIADPDTGLDLFWGLLVPALPLVWFVAPGLWRNLCPLAATNQTPRTLELSRANTAPDWFREYAPVVGMSVFIAAVATRPVLFNDSGIATAMLVLAALAGAFTGGYLLKGKSGWCASICPLLPVQRIYGQTPFKVVPNSHCQPCVGCTKNCYDFNPRVAYLADMYEEDRHYTGYRRFFAGAFPGVVLAYFLLDRPGGDVSTLEWYATFAGGVLASAGSFFLVETLLKVSVAKIAAFYGAVAITAFYWNVTDLWPLSVAVTGLAALWLVRTYRKETAFVAEASGQQTASFAAEKISAARGSAGDAPEVTFADSGLRVVARPGQSLLELAEGSEQTIEAGCRMGVCGADPVRIVDGMQCLSEPTGDERATLERLGWSGDTRMACCARVHGPVSVSMKLERAGAEDRPRVEFAYDPEVQRVVVIGNGIAGVTAADHVRRRHPECAVDVVTSEPHPLYNRMGISRLIYGRSAMVGLHLLPDAWYEDNRITTWLNTHAVELDTQARAVELGTGERLNYDRLILATGSEAFVPELEGFGAPGSFVLRSADDALRIRDYVQRHRAQRAVVAGGGLLGLEAAYAVHKLGLAVTVLEHGPWLLRRQLDERASDLLRTYLQNIGLEILVDADIAALAGPQRVESLTLAGGRELPADVFLMAAGIVPTVDLAAAAGIDVDRGVVVDDRMRTSDPAVFAVGDAAEYDGRVLGLWPAAVEQAEVAAENAVGGDRGYAGTIPVTMLKVVGVELASSGRVEADPGAGEQEIVIEDRETLRYRKLVVDSGGRAAGAILLGFPQYAGAATAAVKEGRDVSGVLDALRTGEWEALEASAVVI